MAKSSALGAEASVVPVDAISVQENSDSAETTVPPSHKEVVSEDNVQHTAVATSSKDVNEQPAGLSGLSRDLKDASSSALLKDRPSSVPPKTIPQPESAKNVKNSPVLSASSNKNNQSNSQSPSAYSNSSHSSTSVSPTENEQGSSISTQADQAGLAEQIEQSEQRGNGEPTEQVEQIEQVEQAQHIDNTENTKTMKPPASAPRNDTKKPSTGPINVPIAPLPQNLADIGKQLPGVPNMAIPQVGQNGQIGQMQLPMLIPSINGKPNPEAAGNPGMALLQLQMQMQMQQLQQMNMAGYAMPMYPFIPQLQLPMPGQMIPPPAVPASLANPTNNPSSFNSKNTTNSLNSTNPQSSQSSQSSQNSQSPLSFVSSVSSAGSAGSKSPVSPANASTSALPSKSTSPNSTSSKGSVSSENTISSASSVSSKSARSSASPPISRTSPHPINSKSAKVTKSSSSPRKAKILKTNGSPSIPSSTFAVPSSGETSSASSRQSTPNLSGSNSSARSSVSVTEISNFTSNREPLTQIGDRRGRPPLSAEYHKKLLSQGPRQLMHRFSVSTDIKNKPKQNEIPENAEQKNASQNNNENTSQPTVPPVPTPNQAPPQLSMQNMLPNAPMPMNMPIPMPFPPQLAGVPYNGMPLSLPNIPPIQGVPGIPANIPGFLPNMPNISMPNIPIANIPNIPNMPNMPNIPNLPNLAIPNLQNIMPGAPYNNMMFPGLVNPAAMNNANASKNGVIPGSAASHVIFAQKESVADQQRREENEYRRKILLRRKIEKEKKLAENFRIGRRRRTKAEMHGEVNLTKEFVLCNFLDAQSASDRLLLTDEDKAVRTIEDEYAKQRKDFHEQIESLNVPAYKDEEGRWRCGLCTSSVTYQYYKHLLRHAANHLPSKPFKCPFCFSRFRRSDTARRHQSRCKVLLDILLGDNRSSLNINKATLTRETKATAALLETFDVRPKALDDLKGIRNICELRRELENLKSLSETKGTSNETAPVGKDVSRNDESIESDSSAESSGGSDPGSPVSTDDSAGSYDSKVGSATADSDLNENEDRGSSNLPPVVMPI